MRLSGQSDNFWLIRRLCSPERNIQSALLRFSMYLASSVIMTLDVKNVDPKNKKRKKLVFRPIVCLKRLRAVA